jgi:hypothetical protein
LRGGGPNKHLHVSKCKNDKITGERKKKEIVRE